jgi:hypothetical protein
MKENSRIYRTEVIWKPERIEDEDPEDSCPIDCKVFMDWCGKLCKSGPSNDRRKKTLIILCAAAFAVLTAALGMANSLSGTPVDLVYESKRSISWNEDLQNEYSLDNMHEISLLHLKDTITLPDVIDDNIADVDEPRQDGDVTYFFHIPRTAGASVKDVSAVVSCYCLIGCLFFHFS